MHFFSIKSNNIHKGPQLPIDYSKFIISNAFWDLYTFYKYIYNFILQRRRSKREIQGEIVEEEEEIMEHPMYECITPLR